MRTRAAPLRESPAKSLLTLPIDPNSDVHSPRGNTLDQATDTCFAPIPSKTSGNTPPSRSLGGPRSFSRPFQGSHVVGGPADVICAGCSSFPKNRRWRWNGSRTSATSLLRGCSNCCTVWIREPLKGGFGTFLQKAVAGWNGSGNLSPVPSER